MFRFLLKTFAVLRLTTLITDDEITRPVREKVWSVYPQDTFIGYLLSCHRCTSVWVAFLLTVLARDERKPVDILLGTLTLSQSAIFLQETKILIEKNATNIDFN